MDESVSSRRPVSKNLQLYKDRLIINKIRSRSASDIEMVSVTLKQIIVAPEAAGNIASQSLRQAASMLK